MHSDLHKAEDASPAQPAPLLVSFKQLRQVPNGDHAYDEVLDLNVHQPNGQCIPVVLQPGSLAAIKTVGSTGGED